jgi:hypothetical protein
VINRRDIGLQLVDIAHFVMFDECRDGDEEQEGRPPNEERLSLRRHRGILPRGDLAAEAVGGSSSGHAARVFVNLAA